MAENPGTAVFHAALRSSWTHRSPKKEREETINRVQHKTKNNIMQIIHRITTTPDVRASGAFCVLGLAAAAGLVALGDHLITGAGEVAHIFRLDIVDTGA